MSDLPDARDMELMRLALAQGRRALPACLRNPPVGCLIVSKGQVVAAGFTQSPGNHHAEAMALSQLSPGLTDLVAYVTLEPCSFVGRTPSCAQAMVGRGIKRVVVALIDPDPRNAGAGVAILREAGIVVSVGLLAHEARADLQPYLIRGGAR